MINGERRRPTVTDVAREAGVSVATAGRVLGDYGNVKPELSEAVRAAAERLDYSANVAARSVRSGRTRSVGFVGADISNPFFAAAMRGVCDVARDEGYEPILINSDDSSEVERNAVRLLLAKQIEGIVVSPTSISDVAHLTQAQDLGVPVVLLDRHSPALNADSVVVDNEAAAHQAVTHLLELGHRDIGLVAMTDPFEGPQLRHDPKSGQVQVHGPARPAVDRIRGYVTAIQDAGLQIRHDLLGNSPTQVGLTEQGEADRMLSLPQRATALFAADNFTTQNAFIAARRLGLDIPADVSLVGFDDLDWTVLVDPPITVVAQSPIDMGRRAAELLFHRIKGDHGPAQRIVLPTRLLMRRSTRQL